MTQTTDRLSLSTPNISEQNAEQFTQMVKTLLPNCVTEGQIDFDLLKQELSSTLVDGPKERYRLEWAGKREAIVTANTPIDKTLRPVREDSVDFDKTENLYIEGDNLEVLKLLQESYLGKVKMIYIDPPYNTGNEFVYNDDFSKEERESLIEQGIIDEDGNILVSDKNSKEKARYHSDWLTFMYPRLKLGRNLLTEDGVIFISIDDNEVHNLRKMCDEVFGEDNFVAQLVWERAYSPKNDAKYISNSHDYILIYTKTISDFVIGRLERTNEANARYTNPDNDPRGVWKPSDMSVKTYNALCDYPITTPTGRVIEPPAARCWSLSKKAFFERLQDNRIYFGSDGNSTPCIKRFLTELRHEGMAPTSILFYKDVGHSQEGAKEVISLFEGKGHFDGPKPTRLLTRLLTLANTKNDSLILDFFSGSSTTAHAVMQLNANDDGNRKFIMVQWPETCDENSETYKNICEIGKERIRRAAKKIQEEKQAKKEQEGIFSENEPDAQDYGFRVFRLDENNLQDVQRIPNEVNQKSLTFLEDNIKPGRTSEDLLFQIMLAWGLKLSLPITEIKIGSHTVYQVDGNALACCFEEGIDETFAEEIAKLQPIRIVFKDASFANDTAKENVKQLLKQLSPKTEMKVI